MARRNAHGARMTVEGLETRSLLSVTTSLTQAPVSPPSGQASFGTLVIEADDDNNRVAVVETRIDSNTSRITVIGFNGTDVTGRTSFIDERGTSPRRGDYPNSSAGQRRFQRDRDAFINAERRDVDRIVFLGGEGNDTFVNLTQVRSVIDGGEGNNLLVGGAANDVILAGAGNDTLIGNRGNDELYGDARLDSNPIFGANGRPTVTILNDGGNDLLLGGRGNDVLRGGRGNDRLIGGAGFDTQIGRAHV